MRGRRTGSVFVLAAFISLAAGVAAHAAPVSVNWQSLNYAEEAGTGELRVGVHEDSTTWDAWTGGQTQTMGWHAMHATLDTSQDPGIVGYEVTFDYDLTSWDGYAPNVWYDNMGVNINTSSFLWDDANLDDPAPSVKYPDDSTPTSYSSNWPGTTWSWGGPSLTDGTAPWEEDNGSASVRFTDPGAQDFYVSLFLSTGLGTYANGDLPSFGEFSTVEVNSIVPEPTAAALLVLGLMAATGLSRRRRRD